MRDVTYDEDRSQIRTGTGPQVMAAIRNAAIGAFHVAGVTNIAAANRHHARNSNRRSLYSASPDDFAGALGHTGCDHRISVATLDTAGTADEADAGGTDQQPLGHDPQFAPPPGSPAPHQHDNPDVSAQLTTYPGRAVK